MLSKPVKEFIEKYYSYIDDDLVAFLSFADHALDKEQLEELCSVLEQCDIHYQDAAWEVIEDYIKQDIDYGQLTVDLERYMNNFPTFKLPQQEVEHRIIDAYEEDHHYTVRYQNGRTMIIRLESSKDEEDEY